MSCWGGKLSKMPESWLEVKDEDGNPVEIKFKKAKKKKGNKK